MTSKVQVLNPHNELLDTNTRLVLASRQVTQYLDKFELIGYYFSNSKTRFIFLILRSSHRLLHPYGPSWIHALGISNNRYYMNLVFLIFLLVSLPGWSDKRRNNYSWFLMWKTKQMIVVFDRLTQQTRKGSLSWHTFLLSLLLFFSYTII